MGGGEILSPKHKKEDIERLINILKVLDDLKNLFSSDGFLILFWTHFLAINLFCGAWIMKDSQRLFVSKYIVFVPITITYFIGP